MLNTEYWFETLRDADGLDRAHFADTDDIASRIDRHMDAKGWHVTTVHLMSIVADLQDHIKPVIVPNTESGDPPFGFLDVFSGVFIQDPYVSTCGRFEVDPTDAYGLDASDLEWLAMLNGVY